MAPALQDTEDQQMVPHTQEALVVQPAEALHHRTGLFIPAQAVQQVHRAALPIPEIHHVAQEIHHPHIADPHQAAVQAPPTAGPAALHPEDPDLQHTAVQAAAVVPHTVAPAAVLPAVHIADLVRDLIVAAAVVHLPDIPADLPPAPVLHQVVVHIHQAEEGNSYFTHYLTSY